MRQRQPAALDVRAIFEAAHEAANDISEDVQSQWEGILARAFGASTWHTERPDVWHASSLGSCPRQQVLKRAGLAIDGNRVESMNTFAIGHMYHALAELGMQRIAAQPGSPYTNVQTEVGGYHRALNLAARADLVYEHQGQTLIVDWKTEAPYGSTARRKDAKARGDESSAKLEHIVQLTATAMVLESLGIVPERIEQGFVVYIEKSSGEIDQQLVVLDDEAREAVELGVGALDYAWQVYENGSSRVPHASPKGTLPPRLAPGHWNCRARSDKDERGLYCAARSTCFALPPLENP